MRESEEGEARPVPVVDANRCDGCGLCVRMCPTCALAVADGTAVVARADRCDYSGLCEMVCPQQAIRRLFEII